MKSKLIFRILGALSSALIVASVFIPFVSVTGYSQSLWQAHESVGTLYLPIMLIAFGVIGILVFSTGFKTELAYASAGGLLFFLIMQTIPIIDQGTFSTLSVGYYCLAVGTLLIIIMAFLCGLRVKQKMVNESKIEETKEISMIDQIDRLYNDQPYNQNLNNNTLDNIIQPLPIGEPLNNNLSVMNNSVSNPVVTENIIQPDISVNSGIVEPVTQNLNTQAIEQTTISNNVSTSVNNAAIDQNNNLAVTNNLVEPQFNVPIETMAPQLNPVVSEFNSEQSNIHVNPVVAEFNTNTPSMPNIVTQSNPVVSEFGGSNVTSNTAITMSYQQDEVIQTLESEKKVDVMADPTNNTSNLDIFG